MKPKKRKESKKIENSKQVKQIVLIFLRYISLIIIILLYNLFYEILLPVTTYSTAFLLNLFHDVEVFNTIIIINAVNIIQIIPACIAASAYILLLILNLSVSMNYKKRIYSILFGFVLLFIINVIRIFILSLLYIDNFSSFNVVHEIFWYLLSTIFVVGIWLISIKIFKIRQIPFYSDFKTIKNLNNKHK